MMNVKVDPFFQHFFFHSILQKHLNNKQTWPLNPRMILSTDLINSNVSSEWKTLTTFQTSQYGDIA